MASKINSRIKMKRTFLNEKEICMLQLPGTDLNVAGQERSGKEEKGREEGKKMERMNNRTQKRMTV